jgi:peptide alpha-N-acetyltransferase
MLEVIPDNSETLCMKGLLLNMTDKEEEGLAMAKAALMKNFKSEICWHVLGIIHRNNKSYGEAIKCYNMALKFDKNNL